jgi:uncharacterized protein
MPKSVMQEKTPAALQVVVETLITRYGPVEKIILFGSRARGQADSYSDTDLIVIKETNERFVKRLANLPFLPIQADIFVYTPNEFAAMQNNGNPFIMNALAGSRVLYP